MDQVPQTGLSLIRETKRSSLGVRLNAHTNVTPFLIEYPLTMKQSY